MNTSPHRQTKLLPKEGTVIRECYDFFLAHKGEVVERKMPGARIADDLRDYYGLDIRCIRAGGKPRWLLKGQYIGKDYVSYTGDKK